MTVPTNLYQKASLKGNREDLIDKIYNTSPSEVPLSSPSSHALFSDEPLGAGIDISAC